MFNAKDPTQLEAAARSCQYAMYDAEDAEDAQLAEYFEAAESALDSLKAAILERVSIEPNH